MLSAGPSSMPSGCGVRTPRRKRLSPRTIIGGIKSRMNERRTDIGDANEVLEWRSCQDCLTTHMLTRAAVAPVTTVGRNDVLRQSDEGTEQSRTLFGRSVT